MKKSFIILIIFLFTALAFSAFLVFKSTNQASTFLVILEEGSGHYKEKDSSDYLEITQLETQLTCGSFVQTESSSFLTILLSDNSIISVDENTQLQINCPENGFSITQLTGNTWHSVNTLTQDGSYTIETPDAIAAVRGTEFGVNITINEAISFSEIFVEESQVEVTNKAFNTKLNLVTGEYSLVEKNKDNFKQNLPDKIKQSAWYTKNKSRNFTKLRESNVKENLFKVLEKSEIVVSQPVEISNVLSAAFENEISMLLEKYTFAEAGSKSCMYYDGKTLESILAEINQTEDNYSVVRVAANQHSNKISFLLNACKDNNITHEELSDYLLVK